MSSQGNESPTSLDETIEYITVGEYEWPKPPASKRARLDEHERRKRHTECQKRFLKRKQQQLQQLRLDVATLARQLQLAEAIRETNLLQLELDQIHMHLSMQVGVSVAPATSSDSSDALIETLFHGLDDGEGTEQDDTIFLSLAVDELLAELEQPW